MSATHPATGALMLGNIVAAGASLLGGLLNRNAAKDAASEANAVAERNAQRNIDLQKEFAQQGIRWKVNDAKAAGIHPLYAMGAQTTSFAPVSVGHTSSFDPSLGNGIARSGQDLSRAIAAGSTAPERATAASRVAEGLTLQKLGLENELLAANVAKTRAQIPPPFPAIAPDLPKNFDVPEGKKSEDRPPLMIFGNRWNTNPNTSPMKAWEDQYGDDGPASWVLPFLIGGNDIMHNFKMRFPSEAVSNAIPRGLRRGSSQLNGRR